MVYDDANVCPWTIVSVTYHKACTFYNTPRSLYLLFVVRGSNENEEPTLNNSYSMLLWSPLHDYRLLNDVVVAATRLSHVPPIVVILCILNPPSKFKIYNVNKCPSALLVYWKQVGIINRLKKMGDFIEPGTHRSTNIKVKIETL